MEITMRITIPRAYFIAGFIFGLMFPVLAILLEIRLNDFPFSMAGVIAAHRSNLLLYMIDTAPIFLGVFAWFAGSRTETIKQIEQLSYHDQLTGLYNRRFLVMAYERLNVIRNLPFTVLALDVNGLKLVNDAFGHHAGDELLIKVANVIKENLRSDDIVARMGGDEFVILLPNTDENIALQLVNRIREDVKLIDVYGITGSISIGQCTADQTMKLDDMLRFADEKMYTIKNYEGQHFRYNAVLSMYEKLLRLNDCEEIHGKYSGKQFDPEIVKAQIEIVSEGYGQTELKQQSRRT